MSRALLVAVVVCVTSLIAYAAGGSSDQSKPSDSNDSQFSDIANFEKKGPLGSVVKVGHDPLSQGGIRFGAGAFVDVSSDSDGKYRFALYIKSTNEAGDVVEKLASIMAAPFQTTDPHRLVVWTTHKNVPTGTYVISALLVAIDKSGAVTVLDSAKTSTYTVP